MTTPRLGAPELVAGQAAPETTVNEIAAWLDAASLGGFKVLDRDLATPPSSPAQGDCYIVATSPTGAWTGQAGNVALYINTAWAFRAPQEAFEAYVVDEGVKIVYTSGAWSIIGTFDGASYLAAANNLSDLASAATARTNLGLGNAALALPVTFNFSGTGEARFYADVAMTLTQQATSGIGTIAYEKSTAAAPGTFASTTSPISLEAGAWLKASASAVTGMVAVHLKRTA